MHVHRSLSALPVLFLFMLLTFFSSRCGADDTRVRQGPTEQPARGNVEIAGVLWHGTLERARVIAEKEQKPILLLQMFGRLDDAMC